MQTELVSLHVERKRKTEYEQSESYVWKVTVHLKRPTPVVEEADPPTEDEIDMIRKVAGKEFGVDLENLISVEASAKEGSLDATSAFFDLHFQKTVHETGGIDEKTCPVDDCEFEFVVRDELYAHCIEQHGFWDSDYETLFGDDDVVLQKESG